jgi:RNA polymerase sigma-70 factor (ECF subfamily)
MPTNQDQNPEFELITLLKGGNERAYFMVLGLYKDQVARTVKGMLGNVQEAEDVGQEVFIRFFKSIDNFKGDAKISTYLTRIAINLSLNALERRKRKWRIFYSDDKLEEKLVSDLGANPIEDVERKEIVRTAIMKLATKYRRIVILRALQEYSFKEVAEALQMPLGTVLSRYARAQHKLREILNPIVNEGRR